MVSEEEKKMEVKADSVPLIINMSYLPGTGIY